MWKSLDEIVNGHTTPLARLFDAIVIALIVLSLITFSLDTLPELNSTFRRSLAIAEMTIVLFFTIEYVLRILATPKPLSYIFSFYGLIDLLAILPFYLALSMDLSSIRSLRLMRLLRILKLTRYNAALNRMSQALMSARDELVIFMFVTVILLYLAAVGIYHFEHAAQPEHFQSIFDCLWWAVATLTTVGYGDIYPVTLGGRVFTFMILMIGLGIVAVPAGIVASSLAAMKKKDMVETELATVSARKQEPDIDVDR